jgi:hypothetical protein
VARLAYRHSYDLSQNHSQSWTLLVQLSSAHDQLLTEIENLDRITFGIQPELSEITTGRWKISQASLRRRSTAMRVYDFLADRLEGPDLAALKMAQSTDQEMMRRSASHVGKWTTQAVCGNWKGYCNASREIRMHMKSHMLLEKQSLYPLLERLAERGI